MYIHLRILFAIIATSQASLLFAEAPNLSWEVVEGSNCTTIYEEPPREITFSNVTPEALSIWTSYPNTGEIELLQRAEIGETENHRTRISLYDHMDQCAYIINLSNTNATELHNTPPHVHAVHGALIGDFHNDYRYLLADSLQTFLCNDDAPQAGGVSILPVEGAGFETTPWQEPLLGQTQQPYAITSCEDMALFLQATASTYWFAHDDKGGDTPHPIFATVASNIVVDFRTYLASRAIVIDPQAIGVTSN